MRKVRVVLGVAVIFDFANVVGPGVLVETDAGFKHALHVHRAVPGYLSAEPNQNSIILCQLDALLSVLSQDLANLTLNISKLFVVLTEYH